MGRFELELLSTSRHVVPPRPYFFICLKEASFLESEFVPVFDRDDLMLELLTMAEFHLNAILR